MIELNFEESWPQTDYHEEIKHIDTPDKIVDDLKKGQATGQASSQSKSKPIQSPSQSSVQSKEQSIEYVNRTQFMKSRAQLSQDIPKIRKQMKSQAKKWLQTVLNFILKNFALQQDTTCLLKLSEELLGLTEDPDRLNRIKQRNPELAEKLIADEASECFPDFDEPQYDNGGWLSQLHFLLYNNKFKSVIQWRDNESIQVKNLDWFVDRILGERLGRSKSLQNFIHKMVYVYGFQVTQKHNKLGFSLIFHHKLITKDHQMTAWHRIAKRTRETANHFKRIKDKQLLAVQQGMFGNRYGRDSFVYTQMSSLPTGLDSYVQEVPKLIIDLKNIDQYNEDEQIMRDKVLERYASKIKVLLEQFPQQIRSLQNMLKYEKSTDNSNDNKQKLDLASKHTSDSIKINYSQANSKGFGVKQQNSQSSVQLSCIKLADKPKNTSISNKVGTQQIKFPEMFRQYH